MSELLPNHGASMKDQISRIEARLDYLYTQLIEKNKDTPQFRRDS